MLNWYWTLPQFDCSLFKNTLRSKDKEKGKVGESYIQNSNLINTKFNQSSYKFFSYIFSVYLGKQNFTSAIN